MARRTMIKHGLVGWDLEWNNSYNTYGVCDDATQIISFSAPIAEFGDESSFRNTVLHEVAHALVGTDECHGPVWKAKCLEIGGDGKVSGPDYEEFRKATAKWKSLCSVTGELLGYGYRRFHHLCLCHDKLLEYVPNEHLTPAS